MSVGLPTNPTSHSQSIYKAATDSLASPIPWEARIFTDARPVTSRDLTHVSFADAGVEGKHYLLHVTVNGVRLPALYDSGAASTCISLGLAEAAGIEVSKSYSGGVTGIEGTSAEAAGALHRPIVGLSEDFCIQASFIIVIPNRAPLMLLGNDIFGNNPQFDFLGLKSGRKKPVLEIYDKTKSQIVEIACVRGPA